MTGVVDAIRAGRSSAAVASSIEAGIADAAGTGSAKGLSAFNPTANAASG